jgi:hypothetical protein
VPARTRQVVLSLSCLLALASRTASGQSPLFQDVAPLTLRLESDFKKLFQDRGEQRVEHPARLRFSSGTDSGSVKVDLRTRGIFRLKNCSFPPIRIDLPTGKVANTVFAGQDKLKLVTHCRGDRLYERNLLKEYALYRAFNALTDTSFRVRLAHVTYIDTTKADTTIRYAFLIESDRELGRRLGADIVVQHRVHDAVTDASYMTLVALFQYLIGNTDWSVWGQHNIAVFSDTATHKLFAIPYDYDFSGAVGAPYASPPAQLPIKTVRERLYRGYCQPDSILTGALARFRSAKDSIYAAVRAVPDLDDRDKRSMLSYFDEFFRTIENRTLIEREFVHRCRVVEQ